MLNKKIDFQQRGSNGRISGSSRQGMKNHINSTENINSW